MAEENQRERDMVSRLRSMNLQNASSLAEDLFTNADKGYRPSEGSSSEDEDDLAMPEIEDVDSPRLKAYLACALTGLEEEARAHIFLLSDTIAKICTDFEIDLYEPRKATDPVHHAHVSHTEVFQLDRQKVLTSDLLICLAHHPSFGAGQELDFAFSSLLPIVVIAPTGRPISRMVRGIPSSLTVIQYSEPEHLEDQLRTALTELRPLLRDRQYSLSGGEAEYIGQRISSIRKALGLTIEDLATVAQVSPEWVGILESAHEKESNPTIMQLRIIATVLKVPLAKLIDPAPTERTALELVESLPQLFAARYGHLPAGDRRVVIKTILDNAMEAIDEAP